MKYFFAILSITFLFLAYWPYLVGIIKKQVKPHVLSWLTWCLLMGLGFILSNDGGGQAGAWIFGFEFIFCFLVTVYALFAGEKNITKLDWLAFVSAMLITVFYIFTKDPIISIFLAAIIDAIGFIPTFRKSYRQPQTESALAFFLFFLSFLLSLFALGNYSFVTVFYPLTLVVTNGVLVIFLIYRKLVLTKIIE